MSADAVAVNSNLRVGMVCRLYSKECIELLRRALEKAETDLQPKLNYHDTRQRTGEDVSSEEEKEDSDEDDDSDHETDVQALKNPTLPEISLDGDGNTSADSSNKRPESKRQAKKSKNPKERQLQDLIQQMGVPPMLELPVDNDLALMVPSSLLDKHQRHYSIESCKRMLQLAQDVATTPSSSSLSSSLSARPVVVLLLRSGRFAGGIFVGEQCVQHRACQKYTVRKGQGKAQSSQDGSSRPKSMGAQLRRQGEVALWKDVKETLQQWKAYLSETPLVLVSCPKTMQKGLMEATGDLFDKRIIRKVPLDIGRPTYESVCAVYDVMMQTRVGKVTAVEETQEELASTMKDICDHAPTKTEETNKQAIKVVEKEFPPFSPLHTFAAEGNLQGLQDLLDSDPDACAELIDHAAGPDIMTALHVAAESASNNVDPTMAATIVGLLLVRGKANPCVVDSRNRVPYFLASCDKVREAFRRARAELGEECWAWDEARVGPALTDEDVARKQEKAAEKKRRQRARQKEKKAREKAQAEEMEQQMKQEEELRKQEEDAKRIRDGLAPKNSTATNVCDFCQTVCNGKRRSQMFQRLNYKYCSSECVQKHKRELMAQAALSRFS